MKRIFDFVVSLFGILVLSPIFLILGLWVKLDSKGPIFYKQLRVGRNNANFSLFKFRTMRVGSEKYGLITIGDRDSRVTRSGLILRKYKLDELPQLLNVLWGEMSFVGPRPEVRKYVELYTENQIRVLTVRPGITDAASIRYRNENEILASVENPETYYCEVVMQEKLKMNLDYIDKQNFWYDLKVIVMTLINIIKY